MKIEVGKYYKTRDGRKVGPMSRWSEDVGRPFEVTGDSGFSDVNSGLWSVTGSCTSGVQLDLIAEWGDQTQEPNLAEQAKQHGILITVTNGDITITYDGRPQ